MGNCFSKKVNPTQKKETSEPARKSSQPQPNPEPKKPVNVPPTPTKSQIAPVGSKNEQVQPENHQHKNPNVEKPLEPKQDNTLQIESRKVVEEEHVKLELTEKNLNEEQLQLQVNSRRFTSESQKIFYLLEDQDKVDD